MQCCLISCKTRPERFDPEIPPQITKLFMSIGNEILCSHTRRICIIDQHGIEAHILFPVINHNKRTGHSADQVNVRIHHLCSQKDHSRRLVIHDPLRLFLVSRISFIQIAHLHFHSTGAAFLFHPGNQLDKKGGILNHSTIPLKHDKFYFADMIFLKIPKILRHFKNLRRCLSIHAFFVV